jgi:DNA recombination protein RmuC
MPEVSIELVYLLICGGLGVLAGGALVGWVIRIRCNHEHERDLADARAERMVLDERALGQQETIAQLRTHASQLSDELCRLQLRCEQLQAANAALESQVLRIPVIEREKVCREEQLSALQQQVSQQHTQVAQLRTALSQEQKQAAEKIALLNTAGEQLKEAFQNLANRIFEEKSSKFIDQNRVAVDHLIGPLREQIGDFKRRVEDVYDKETRDRTALHAEITHLKDLNQRISKEALNLTRALKGDSKARGNWGEVILARVLEASGLQKGREYDCQVSLRDAEGNRYLPDAVVRLPEGRDVIIDAKLSLKAYEAFYNSEDPLEKKKHLAMHIEAMRTHIRSLAAKSYETLEGVCTLDFILIFVPIEAAFLVAVETDGALFSEAFEKNIIVVSPSTLLVTLRTIQNIWRHEYQNRNAVEIAKKAGALYDKFVGFVASLDEVGQQLDRARTVYQLAHDRLTGGRGNLVRRAQELKELGVKAGKALPREMLDMAADENASVGDYPAGLSSSNASAAASRTDSA